MEEIWKDVQGFEGYYQISNLGNVKSLERTIIRSDGVVQTRKERIMNKRTSTDGYYIAKFNINHHSTSIAIHRLVAIHFIPNPDNKPYIDHINGIRFCNYVWNLRWCTQFENLNTYCKCWFLNAKFGELN